MSKPPYEVPSMDEVRALPWNGLTAVSTFSGCGGSSLGYRMAGFRMLWASEFVAHAQETYRTNAAPYTILDGRDIRDVTGSDILAATGLDVGEIDVFDGSPPCMSFSTSGKREKGWGKVNKYTDHAQRSDDLFFEYARLVEETQPRTFVAENVTGLVKGTAKGYFKLILARLRECGYTVSARVLDASWLGVPQARQRLIFVGVRNDLNIEPVHPEPLPYRYSVAEAVAGVSHADDVTADPETGENIDFRRYAVYPIWQETAPGHNHKKRFNLCRPHPNRPSFTLMATFTGASDTGGVCHWAHPRKLTLAEIRRVGSFPDDFVLPPPYTYAAGRIGNAVPPVMMRAVAERLRDDVLSPAGVGG